MEDKFNIAIRWEVPSNEKREILELNMLTMEVRWREKKEVRNKRKVEEIRAK